MNDEAAQPTPAEPTPNVSPPRDDEALRKLLLFLYDDFFNRSLFSL